MSIDKLKKLKTWKTVRFDDPISYQVKREPADENKVPGFDQYRILGLKNQSGELFCISEVNGVPQKLIFDDLPAHVRDSIGMKLLPL